MSDFEWDERKRQRNLEEHGVDFIDATLIFQNLTYEAKDCRGRYGEIRIRALVGEEYFLVVYTWRGFRRRIISAWKAGSNGRRRYRALLDG